VSLSHGFSAATAPKRPLSSPAHLRHGSRIENTFYYCRRIYSCCLALGMARTTLKTLLLSELLRNSAKQTVYQESVFAGTCISSRCLAMGIHVTLFIFSSGALTMRMYRKHLKHKFYNVIIIYRLQAPYAEMSRLVPAMVSPLIRSQFRRTNNFICT
jgi:hypothetical protein